MGVGRRVIFLTFNANIADRNYFKRSEHSNDRENPQSIKGRPQVNYPNIVLLCICFNVLFVNIRHKKHKFY